MWWLSIVVFAVIWCIFDVIAGGRSYKYRKDELEFAHRCDDFQILVPIYGNVKYLQNIDYLLKYREKVVLCTSSGQTTTFYAELEEIAKKHNFYVYQSPFEPATVTRKRATGGMTRDAIIRDALLDDSVVTAKYVVPIDADTVTPLDLELLVGELEFRDDDMASVRLVPQQDGPMIVQLQRFEYRLAMRIRYLFPWLVSGACHIARTNVLREVMRRHSLFFQGNDVETGLLAEQLGYKISHIPFPVDTEVPSTLRGWWRQRLAWAGGEFRLFIVNIQYVFKHPFFWLYGAVIAIALVFGRWYMLLHPAWGLLFGLVAYYVMMVWLHWRDRNWWLALLPAYTLVTSIVLVALGIIKYFLMVIESDGNWGLIRPERVSVMKNEQTKT